MKKLKLFYLLSAVLFLGIEAKADHFFGADISYRVLDTNTAKYRFTVTLYRSCSGITFFINTNLSVRTSKLKAEIPMTLLSKQEVTPQCQPPDVPVKPATNCPGQTPMLANGTKGVERWIYTVDYTFGKNAGWVFVGYQECCRNLEITTGQTWQNAWVQAALNTEYHNNSTIFRSPPIPYWCRNRVNTYNHGAIDSFDSRFVTIAGRQVIRDSLNYVLICPFLNEAPNPNDAAQLKNPCCTFNSGLSATNFLYTVNNSISFDNKTGQYTCVPDRVQDAVMAIAVEEWRAIPNGSGGYTRVKVGYVCRDVQITVREACPDIITPGVIEDSLVNSNKISFEKVDICGALNAKVTFKLVGPPNQTLLTKVVERPKPEAIINFKYVENKVRMNQTDTIFGTVTFDSAVGVGSERLLLEVYYCDVIGNKVSRYYNLTINFRPAVRIRNKVEYYCIGGKPALVCATGASKYRWTPKTGIVDATGTDSACVKLAPTNSTTYTVKGIDGIDSTQSCSIVDSIRVIVIPRFNYSLAPKVSDLCLHDTVQINLATQVSNAPYIYTWKDMVSSGSLYNPTNNRRTDTISSPKIVVSKSGTYVIEMSDKFKCLLTDSIRINMGGVRPVASGLSARKLLCPGDTTLLSVNVIPKTCGPSIFNCTGTDKLITVTSGTSSIYPTVTSSFYPNPFNTTGIGQASTTRIIYTRTELLNSGVRPGIIKSIAFNLLTINIPNIDKLEVRIGSTLTTDARALNIPMFTIFGPASKSFTSGFAGAKFSITGGFDWDGISNIVLETHCLNSTSFTQPNYVSTMGTVAGNQVAYKLASIVGQDAENSTNTYVGAGSTSAKPRLEVEYCLVDSTPTNILNAVWTPSNLITNVTNPRAIGKVTQKDSVFIATVGTSLCFDTALVRLNIDQNFKVKVNPGKRVYCASGSSNPTINLSATVTGGTGTTMLWSLVSSTTGSHGMSAGPHTSNSMTITPGIGQHIYVIAAVNGPCNAADTVVITVNSNIPVSLKTDSSLCTASNGKMKALLPAGSVVDSFNFTWRQGSPSGTIIGNKDSIVNLAPNTYYLDISLKSDATCTGAVSGVLSARLDTITSAIFTSKIRCKGLSADSIWVNVTSTTGSGNYKYNWSPAAASDSFYKLINKPEGIYTLTITDRITGCQGRKAFNHISPDTLTIILESLNPIKCKGGNDGEIKIRGNGGTLNGGSYIYQWSGINSQNSPLANFSQLINLYADSLCVTVTDAENCIATACFKITEPSKSLTIDSMSRACATTVGGIDGAATVYISGGTSNFNYKWQRSDASPVNGAAGTTTALSNHTITNLNKQKYCVTVTDQNGCKASNCIMLCDIICNWKYVLKSDTVKCYDSATGTILVGAIDSLNFATTANYTYTLYKNSTANSPIETILKLNHYPNDTARFQDLKSGLYLIRLQTNKGCDTVITGIDIPQNNAIQGITSSQMPSCFGASDGKVCVVVSDKFRPFQYDYGNGFILDSCDTSQTSGVNKSLVVRNSLGCQVSWLYTIPTPDSISILVPPMQTRCKSGTTTDPVKIQVTSANPSLLSSLGYMNKPGVNVDTTSNSLVSVTGGLKNIVVNYNNVASGKRCAKPHTFTVTEPDTLVLSLVQALDPKCSYTFDGKFDVTLNVGQRGNSPINLETYAYQLSKNGNQVAQQDDAGTSITFDNLDSGDYTLRVTDPKGCTNSFNYTLNKPDTFKVGFGNITDANCIGVANGSITVTSHTGGNGPAYYYHWMMTDNLDGSVKPIVTDTTIPTVSMLRGLAKYQVTVYDSNRCTATRETVIDTMYQLRITSVTVDSADCFGRNDGSITINTIHPSTAPTPFTYAFSGGVLVGNSATQLLAGTYTYIVTDAVGCQTTGKSTVSEPSDIIVLGTIRNATCNALNGPADGSVKITYSGGTPPYGTPVWNSVPNQQFTDSAIGLPAGLHTVLVTDSKGCLSSKSPITFTVQQPKPIIATIGRYKDITCYAADDGEIDIKVIGDVPNPSYTWSRAGLHGANPRNLKPATDNNRYRVTVTDANGCSTIATQEIKEPKKLDMNPTHEDVTCPKFKDGVINIQAIGGTVTELNGYEYSIDGGTTYFSSSKFTGLAGKDYNLVLRDNNGCISARKYTVNEPEELFVTAKKDSSKPDTLTMGNQVELSYDTLTLSGKFPTIKAIQWTPGMALNCSDCARPKASPYVTTLYEVELTYGKDCKSKSKINIPVYDPLDFFVPSAFSPGNSDGLNDKLYIYGNGVKKASLLIFNRWGEKVFESDHITLGWDGIYKNEPQPSGVYSFSAEVEYLNGEKRTKKGSITLTR